MRRLRQLFRRQTLCVFRWTSNPLAVGNPITCGLHLGTVDPCDFGRWPIFATRGREQRFRERLSAGHRCFGWRDPADGSIAGYFWLTIPVRSALRVPFSMGLQAEVHPGAAYLWDCRIGEGWQNRGLYQAGLRALVNQAMNENANAVWIAAEPSNSASVVAIERAGAEPVAIVRAVRLGRMVAVKRTGMSFVILRQGERVIEVGSK